MAARSAEEEELWSCEVASWDSLKAGNLRGHMSLLHDDVVAWPSHASAPMNKDAIVQHTLALFSALQSPDVTHELKPLSFRILGNVGIVQYEARIRVRGQDERHKFSRTWLRTDGGWRLLAGMSAPVAA